jgi:large subunit ribosomal protein L14
MKAIPAKIIKGINVGTRLNCIDNSGAKILEVIAVKRYKGRKRRVAKAGIGDVVVCSIKRGSPKIRDEIPLAVIVRQKKEWRRPDGMRIRFEDNAAVLINEKFEPRGNEIKGVIAKEVVQRFSAIGKIASVIV